jgi:hypothetical protein
MRRIVLVLLLFSVPTAGALAACLHYDVPDVALHVRIYPYQPSSSSSASTVRVGYVVTAHPICLRGDAGNLPVKSVSRFSYVMATGNHQDLAAYQDQSVAVIGHFLPTYIPHYHPVPIFVVTLVKGRTLSGP